MREFLLEGLQKLMRSLPVTHSKNKTAHFPPHTLAERRHTRSACVQVIFILSNSEYHKMQP